MVIEDTSSNCEGEAERPMEFLPEGDPAARRPQDAPPDGPGVPWKILVIDDDPGFQQAMAFTLSGTSILGREATLRHAHGYAEGVRAITAEPDIAVILLDVIMETDDAGLRLVKAVRETLGNAEVRIVLVTGQPGMAPMRDVMDACDINDYWAKADLSAERLSTVLTASARAYSQIRAVSQARRGLQLIVETSNALFGARTLSTFAATVLGEIASLLGLEAEGLICARRPPAGRGTERPAAMVVGAAGQYAGCVDRELRELPEPSVIRRIEACLEQRRTIADGEGSVFFFSNAVDGADYAAYVATRRRLDPTEEELLRVFMTNVGGGLHNVSLVSRLDEMAYQDDLLKIPNRNALMRALTLALEPSVAARMVLALVDVDGFSGINMAFGTEYGDQVLVRVAARLRQAFGPKALVARISDDLFGVLGPADAVATDAIARLFGGSYSTAPEDQFISVSTATLPLGQVRGGASGAITAARIALREAKRHGLGQHRSHDEGLESGALERFHMLHDLRRAIEAGQLQIALQPKVRLADGTVSGAEALARWVRPDGRPVSPATFIPVAETTGLIFPLGMQVLTLSCRAASTLAAAGFGAMRIAVNVSAIQLVGRDFVERALALIAAEGIEPGQVEIEVTESSAMQGFAQVQEVLERCRAAGMRIAIDDFGTGFSSLAYLHRLPANTLKIDRSFVARIGDGAAVGEGEAIAETVIRLGATLGMEVVAEGVETEAQAAWLRERGCGEAQGYLFARPMPVPEFVEWLAARTGGR